MIDLEHLGRQTAGDAELQRELLGLFLDQLEALTALLREASLPPGHLGSALHRLRGASAAVGAMALAERLASVEADADQLPSPDRATLGDAVEETRRAVARLIAAPPAGSLAKAGESR